MTGIEFVISKSDPPSFFLIYKCNRKSSENVEIIDIYYIIDGTIFMAPRLADVVLFRAVSESKFISISIILFYHFESKFQSYSH